MRVSELAFRNPKERRDRLPLVVQALEGGTVGEVPAGKKSSQGVLRKQWRRGVGRQTAHLEPLGGSPPCLAELVGRGECAGDVPLGTFGTQLC
jgi:hypothetical protein